MIAVDYMQSCGRIGLSMADEIISRVPLNLASTQLLDSPAYSTEGVKDLTTEADTILPIHAVRFCQSMIAAGCWKA